LSIIGEELGLLGVLAVLTTFAIFVGRGLRTAYRARDVFGTYLAFGITAMFGLQALTNIGVVLGSLPAKGLTLPFISYGGSSLIVSLFMAGVLVNISARNPEPKGGWSLGFLFLGRGNRAKAKNRRRDVGPKVVIEVERKRKPKVVDHDVDHDETAGAPVAREADQVTARHTLAAEMLAEDEARRARITASRLVALDGGRVAEPPGVSVVVGDQVGDEPEREPEEAR
jgi:hypothetical protein